jgi:hypothetical protein
MRVNNLELDIFINGENIPLSAIGSPFIQIDTCRDFGIPICHLEITDQTGLIRKSIADGVLFTIVAGTSTGTQTEYEFRVTKPVISDNVIGLRGYLNHPAYLTEIVKKPIRGNSSDVFTQCCDKVGLFPVIENTVDTMTWAPNNTNWLNYVRNVCRHSYQEDSSIMYGAIALDGSMIVRNLNKEITPIATFGATPDASSILELAPVAYSVSNIFGGYKETAVQHALKKENSKKLESMGINAINVNQHPRMRNIIGKGLDRHYKTIHQNNVHPFFNQAEYNNSRGLKMFTRFVDLSYNYKTTINPLDTVLLKSGQSSSVSQLIRDDTNLDGVWTVLTKGIVIKDWKYYERMRLMSVNVPEIIYRG